MVDFINEMDLLLLCAISNIASHCYFFFNFMVIYSVVQSKASILNSPFISLSRCGYLKTLAWRCESFRYKVTFMSITV